MRRADRLFEIVQLLQSRRFMTADRLAEALEVSARTIYRDIRALMASGVPIDGEAGVGYTLHRKFDLPPLMFDSEEIQALLLGARIVQSWADPELAAAAKRALIKVEAVLPEQLRPKMSEATLFAPKIPDRNPAAANLGVLRGAIDQSAKVRFDYTRIDGEGSARTVRPLGLFFWGTVWSLAAWCEMREDFRNFRVDRIAKLSALEEAFAPEPGRRLEDYLDT
jgi:predicted DNA-binding transcriptional regulator YafY